jgi:hypothetical protein
LAITDFPRVFPTRKTTKEKKKKKQMIVMMNVLRKMMTMMLMLLYVLTFAGTTTTVMAQPQKACPPTCEPEGTCVPCQGALDQTCVGEFCRCNDGYGGDDCSLLIQTCPPSQSDESMTECYNGGDCVLKEIFADEMGLGQSEQVWRCDCTTAMGMAKSSGPRSHAGLQCEFPATQSCMLGGSLSLYAFCVNGGDCIRKVNSRESHPGCICPDAYEGRHCQYEKGTAPPEELQAARADIMSNDNGMEPGMITFVVILALLVLSAFGWFIWKKRTTTGGGSGTGMMPSKELPMNPPNDLTLAEDNTTEHPSATSPTMENINDDMDDGEHKEENEEEDRPQVV